MITCTTTVGLTSGHIDVSLWYVVMARRTQRINYDEKEFSGVEWFSYSAVPLDRSDPHLNRFIAKLTSNRRIDRGITEWLGRRRVDD
jgi:8-oxo-dGTP diphosphatase